MKKRLMLPFLFLAFAIKGFSQSAETPGMATTKGTAKQAEDKQTHVQPVVGGAKFDGKNKGAQKRDNVKSGDNSTPGMAKFTPAKDTYKAK